MANQSGGSFTFQVNATIFSDGSATSFSNAGSLTQPAGVSGNTNIDTAFTQSATGSTSVQAGMLVLAGGGTVSGLVSVMAGSKIEFDGPSFSLTNSSTITGAGEVGFNSAGETVTVAGTYDVTGGTQALGSTVSFTAPITHLGSDLYLFQAEINLTGQSFSLATLEVYSSTLNGAGGASLAVTGTMNCFNDTVTGFGAVVIPSGAVLNLGQSGSAFIETLVGATLENAGTVNVIGNSSPGYANAQGLSLQSGASVANQSGGSFTFQVNATIFSDGSATSFSNAGSLTQPAGVSGNTNIDTAFTQSATGSTSVQAGMLVLAGGGTVSGLVSVMAGSKIEFDGPSFSLTNSSTITGAGEVGFNSAGETVTVAGTYDVTGGTQALGSTVSFTAPITHLGSDLYLFQAEINLTGQSFSLATLEVYSSTLNGAGGASLAVTGTMNCFNDTVTGFGAVVIPSGAVLNLGQSGGAFIETLVGATLENAGTVNVIGNSSPGYANAQGLSLQSGASVANQSGGSFTFQVNATIFSDGSATSFSNAGSLTQPAGVSGNTNIDTAFTQSATGSTSVQAGMLVLAGGGTVSGLVSVMAGSKIEFDGPSFSLTNSSTITGAGEVGFNSAGETVTVAGTYDVTGGTQALGSTVSFTAPITHLGSDLYLFQAEINLTGQSFSLATLEVYSSTLNGAGGASLAVTGTMNCFNDTVTGFGAVVIPSGAVLNLGQSGGTFIETLVGATLENAGTVNVIGNSSPGYANAQGLSLQSGASVANQSGGSFTFQVNATIFSDGSATSFSNAGSLTQPAGVSGNTNIDTAFTQSATGSTSVQAGMLVLAGGGTVSGLVTGAAGTTLEFGGSSFTLGASTNIISVGNVAFATASLTVDVGGTTAASQYPRATVSGTASLDGTFNVALVNNFQPAVGNTFQILTFGSSSGNFTAYSGLSLGGGVFLDPVFSASSFTLDADQVAISGAPALSMKGVPITVTGSITGPSAGNTFTFSWIVTQNGNPFSSGTGSPFSFTPNLNGTYVVGLTVTDTAGGEGTVSVQVIVGPSIVILDSSAGGALSVSGNASINVPGEVVVDSSSSTALSASGNAQIKATVIDVHGGVSKNGNASFSPAPTTGAADCPGPIRVAHGTEHDGIDQLRISQSERELLEDDQSGHLHRDHPLRQRHAHDERRHLHHRGRRIQRLRQCKRQRHGRDDLQCRQQVPHDGRHLRQYLALRQWVVQPDATDHRYVCGDRHFPAARQHQAPHDQRQRVGDDRRDLRFGSPAIRERQCVRSMRRSMSIRCRSAATGLPIPFR